MPDNKEKKAGQIALEILAMARTKLLINLRFLEMALSRLEPEPQPRPDTTSSIATDGMSFIFSPMHILAAFRVEENLVARDYLHTLLHCVFRHMFVNADIDRALWDVACDIAVESAINELGSGFLETLKAQRQEQIIAGYKTELPMLSAEKIYRFLRGKRLSQKALETLRMLFKSDDHLLWYLTDGERTALGIGGGSSSTAPRDADAYAGRASAEKDWESISEHIQMELETFGRQRGTEAGRLAQNLRDVNRERYNYTEFLKKFAVRGEAMKLNADEFDYNYYTYGLQLYENMPLIEPLEYKEVNAVRDLVIAIDTSASTSGELVEKFVRKSYNILKSTESFFDKINLHIVQCDAAIQEDVKITTQEEFDAYIGNMTIKGLGGTDFRPLFSYVDSLVEIGELADLKGLIYFTDGAGIFPTKTPPYKTAFVFVDSGGNNYEVPPWAIKLVLDKDDI